MVAVLFAKRDSIYKSMPCLNVYDEDRDARTWPGGEPLVAHPPCRTWGRLRGFANAPAHEHDLAINAVLLVRAFGGVLEHPAYSTLWKAANLPAPGLRDQFGGFTFPIDQNWFGHRAQKRTFLYIVGIEPANLPPFWLDITKATHVIESRKRKGCLPKVTKPEREATPPALAAWLIAIAKLCTPFCRLNGAKL